LYASFALQDLFLASRHILITDVFIKATTILQRVKWVVKL
jgi:hypothetical protein